MTTFLAVDHAVETGAIVAGLHAFGGGDDFAVVRDERLSDSAMREDLLDRTLGRQRLRKSSEILRAGRMPAERLSLLATVNGALAGTVRLWHVTAGDREALLLGPLAIDVRFRSFGLGAALMDAAIGRATRLGHGAILLVGDAAYYDRFGFSSLPTAGLVMPGDYDQQRFLGLDLQPGYLDNQRGLVLAAGKFAGVSNDALAA